MTALGRDAWMRAWWEEHQARGGVAISSLPNLLREALRLYFDRWTPTEAAGRTVARWPADRLPACTLIRRSSAKPEIGALRVRIFQHEQGAPLHRMPPLLCVDPEFSSGALVVLRRRS